METKKCLTCEVVKSTKEFHKGSNGAKHNPHCKYCRSIKQKKEYQKNWFHKISILKRSWCKKHNMPFNLTGLYLKSIWTPCCPITGNKFVLHNKKHPDSPALDRLDSSKGYIKGNVCWISSRMNRIKYDASVEELRNLLTWFEGATTISKESTPKREEAPDTAGSSEDIVSSI